MLTNVVMRRSRDIPALHDLAVEQVQETMATKAISSRAEPGRPRAAWPAGGPPPRMEIAAGLDHVGIQHGRGLAGNAPKRAGAMGAR